MIYKNKYIQNIKGKF